MANIITELHLEMSDNWYVSKKLNSVGRVGENTVTKLIIEPTEILDNVTYEIEIADASGSKNVAELTIDGTELYLILTANMLTVSGIMKMQVRGLFTDGSIKKSNIFELKVNRSISATEHYEEYAVTIFDQLVQDCRDIIEGAESYAIRAETAAVNAEAYEQSASASAEAASASEATATSASVTAVNAAASAETSANTASTSAETATTAANSASASASTAQTSAQTATSASVTAQSASEVAQTASTAATSAATSAKNSATSATTAANNASASATSAAADATNAAISETNASTSATNAHTSETNAANSATSASNSATSASTSATNAANSASAAATSATNAHNSEVNASNSETNASTSATEAAASAESIAASVAQINENTYRINDLEAIIAGYQLTDLPTGAVASVADGTALLMPSLKVDIEPAQDLHGYDHPWAGGGGKNKFDYDTTYAAFKQSDGTFRGAANQVYPVSYKIPSEVVGSQLTFSVFLDLTNFEAPTWVRCQANVSGSMIRGSQIVNGTNGYSSITFTPTSTDDYITLVYGTNGDNPYTFSEIQLEVGATRTSFSPYSNICPISGWTEANVSVSSTTSAEDGATYTIQFKDGDNPLTVYGGTLDVTSGELVVDRAEVDISTFTWKSATDGIFTYATDLFGIAKTYPNGVPNKVIFEKYQSKPSKPGGFYPNEPNVISLASNGYLYTVADTSPTGQCVYELAEPITYHLTPTQIRTLVGNNNIWADTGDIIEGKYFKSLT